MKANDYKLDLPWQLTIRRADNGYIVSHKIVLDGALPGAKESVRINEYLIEEQDDLNSADAMKSLLYNVAEFFGVYQDITIKTAKDVEDEE